MVDVYLIKDLEELRIRLNNSGVQRTAGLLKELGHDCVYYQSSLRVFNKKDREEIKNLLRKVLNSFG